MKTLCKSYANFTNDINKYFVKKSICKIFNDLDVLIKLLNVNKHKYKLINYNYCNKL